MTGCCANAAPLAAEGEGCRVIASCAAGPIGLVRSFLQVARKQTRRNTKTPVAVRKGTSMGRQNNRLVLDTAMFHTSTTNEKWTRSPADKRYDGAGERRSLSRCVARADWRDLETH